MRHTTFDGDEVTVEDFPDDPTEVAAHTIEDRLRAALDTNKAYLALDTPTAAQQRAQVARLTRQTSALIRLVLSLLDTDDTGD